MKYMLNDTLEIANFFVTKRNSMATSKESMLSLEQLYNQMFLIKEHRVDVVISSLFIFGMSPKPIRIQNIKFVYQILLRI